MSDLHVDWTTDILAECNICMIEMTLCIDILAGCKVCIENDSVGLIDMARC